MIPTLLSPEEIMSSIKTATPMTSLVINIRNGEWDAVQLSAVVEQLERDISEKKRCSNDRKSDKNYDNLLALLAVTFYAKDKFGYSKDSREHQLIRRLFGNLLAALGMN